MANCVRALGWWLAFSAPALARQSLPVPLPPDSARPASAFVATDTIRKTPSRNPAAVRPDRAYVRGYYRDTKAVLKAPFHWKKPDFLKLAAVTGITVGLYVVDGRLRDWSQAHKTDFTTGVSEVVDPLGNGRYL